VLCAVGGSTNVLIHLQAVAGRAGLHLGIDELRALSASTPLIADVRPSGAGLLEELQDDGGVPAVMGRLGGLVDLATRAGDGRPWREVVTGADAGSGAGSARLRTVADPVGPAGALCLLSGSLAPAGALLKRSAATEALCRHRGRAVVFDGVEDMRARIDDPGLPIDPSTVLVLRGAGPVGGPGMPEVGHLPLPRRLLERGVTDMVRISDARMSGTAEGTVVLHVAPESAVGGPLALVRDGDEIVLDADAARLDLLVDPEELRRRVAPPRAAPEGRGFARLYQRHVTQADRGCDFDFLAADHGR
jgi:dihydroxyacid dehydratase/phosphogluconate dehydratase